MTETTTDLGATIISELLLATKLMPIKKRESKQKFWERLARAVNALDDADYDLMTKTSQGWSNAAIESILEKSDINAPGADPDPQPQSEAADPGNIAPADVDEPAKPLPKRRDGIVQKYVELVLQDPNRTVAEIMAAGEKRGLEMKRASVWAARYWIRLTIKYMQEGGHKLPDFDLK